MPLGVLLTVVVWITALWAIDGLLIPDDWPESARTFALVVAAPLAFLAVFLAMTRLPQGALAFLGL